MEIKANEAPVEQINTEAVEQPTEIQAEPPPIEIEPTTTPGDDARAAIYQKHADMRKAEVGQEPTPAEGEELEELVTVKVNGREKVVPKAKIEAAGGIEAYQKNAAASEMLNHASAEARKVREQAEALAIRERDIAEREERLKQQTQTETTAPRLPADAGALKSLARQYHDAMLDGDIDRADELLIQINAAQTATAINPDEIAQRAVQKARDELTAEQRKKDAEKFERDRQSEVSAFNKKHSDLASNSAAFAMVDAETTKVYREHPDWTPAAIIDEAAERVRGFIKSVSTPSSSSEKLDAKRGRTQISGGSARSATPPAPAPQTNSGYVAELRKARGLDV